MSGGHGTGGGGVFGGGDPMDNAFEGKIYALALETRHLPDRWPGKPLGTIYTKQLDVPRQAFDKGFPGVDARFEWFGLEYTAEFYVRTEGDYFWWLTTDDGGALFIDGNRILYDPDAHAEKTVTAKRRLREGKHSIRVKYYQGPKVELALQLWIQAPGMANRAIFSLDDYPLTAE